MEDDEEDDEEAQLLAVMQGGRYDPRTRRLLTTQGEATQIQAMVVQRLVDDMTAKVLGHVDRPEPQPQQLDFKDSAQVQKLVASTTEALTAKLLAELHPKAPPLLETQLPEVVTKLAEVVAPPEQAPPMVETQLPQQEPIWHHVQSHTRLCVRTNSPCESYPCRVELMDVASYGGPDSLAAPSALHQDPIFAHQMAPLDEPRPAEAAAGGSVPAPALVHSRVELTFEGTQAYTATPLAEDTMGENSFEDGVGVEWATRASLQGEEDRPPPEMIAERMLAILAATDIKCQPGMSTPRSSAAGVAIGRPCLYKESDAL